MNHRLNDADHIAIARRIKLLEEFAHKLGAYAKNARKHYDSVGEAEEAEEAEERQRKLRSEINRKLVAVQHIIRDLGIDTKKATSGYGGRGSGTITDVFDEIFEYGSSTALDIVERALGSYETMRDDPGLIRMHSKESLDVLEAIRRALRPQFTDPPKNERAIQDATEHILRALGIPFSREKERAVVGDVAYTPDFTVPALSLALELKYANNNHGEKDIVREISDDITGYGTRWKYRMFVVYDNGVLVDPVRLEETFAQKAGITTLVIKH